jgi:hypothetical protein
MGQKVSSGSEKNSEPQDLRLDFYTLRGKLDNLKLLAPLSGRAHGIYNHDDNTGILSNTAFNDLKYEFSASTKQLENTFLEQDKSPVKETLFEHAVWQVANQILKLAESLMINDLLIVKVTNSGKTYMPDLDRIKAITNALSQMQKITGEVNILFVNEQKLNESDVLQMMSLSSPRDGTLTKVLIDLFRVIMPKMQTAHVKITNQGKHAMVFLPPYN